MINLRYHIVSLVAVFLALAVGVIAGTTVISENLVQNLRDQRTALINNRNLLEAENEALTDELDLWENYGRALETSAITGKLTGRSLVLVTKADVPGDLIESLEDLTTRAGAVVAGRITFTPKWKLEDDTARAQLALALGQPETTEVERLVADTATRIATRLRTPADPSIETDLISQLQRAGFLTTHDLAAGTFPPNSVLYVFVSPGVTNSLPPDRTFMIPLFKGLAAGSHAVVAEPLGSAESLADRIRGDRDLRAAIATVDHVDTVPGRMSLVTCLRDLATGLQASHFGTGRRTAGVAPSPSPVP